MSDATMQASVAETARHPAALPVLDGGMRDDDRLPLPGSVMLIVLGSGACWFVLSVMVRWMFF